MDTAIDLAIDDARDFRSAPADGVPRTVHAAIGDAQAPFPTFLTILDRHGLLGDHGRLKPEVHLVSIGDHFDYGPPAWRTIATEEATRLLAWLAAHPADQVTLVFGNHDCARVSDLAGLDDATYRRAREEADRAYRLGELDEALDAAFVERWPQFPDAEILARDYSTFDARQAELVSLLLRERRFRLAHAYNGLLFVHAGVTTQDLAAIGAPRTGPAEIAAALNAFLDSHGPHDLLPLYQPGSKTTGEARGVLAHRPAHPAKSAAALFEGPPRRRFDPRDLPAGVTQVIGHIRDGKCRDLLGEWAEPGPARDGPLRQLHVRGDTVRYTRGVSRDAAMIFIDGGMNYAPANEYALLDADGVRQLSRG